LIWVNRQSDFVTLLHFGIIELETGETDIADDSQTAPVRRFAFAIAMHGRWVMRLGSMPGDRKLSLANR
jgi:hypothetical protein